MGEDYAIDLLNFTSVLELLCAYYLLLGITEKLRNYLEITTWFKDWIDNDYTNEKKLEDIENNLKMNEDFNNKHLQDSITRGSFVKKILSVCSHQMKDQIIKQKKKKKKRILKKIELLRRKIPLFYPVLVTVEGSNESLDDEYSTRYLESAKQDHSKITYSMLIRPVYLYFGVLSIYLLIMAGSFTAFKRELALSWINFFSFVMLVCFLATLIYRKFRGNYVKFFTPVKTFLLTIAIIGILVVLPKELLAEISIVPYGIPAEIIPNSNFQVILCIILRVTPLLINIFSLTYIVNKLHTVRNYYRSTLNPLQKATILEPEDIPVLKG